MVSATAQLIVAGRCYLPVTMAHFDVEVPTHCGLLFPTPETPLALVNLSATGKRLTDADFNGFPPACLRTFLLLPPG